MTRRRLRCAMILLVSLSACIPLPPARPTGYLVDAALVGRPRADVLAEIGLPTAVLLDGSFLYLIPAKWYSYNGLFVYRVVRFDAQGTVVAATPSKETRRGPGSLVVPP